MLDQKMININEKKTKKSKLKQILETQLILVKT